MLMHRAASLPAVLLAACVSIVTAASPPLPRQRPATPPSAASFYVPQVPSLVRDPSSPLHVWAGHISADPNAKVSPASAVTAQLYFVLTKARRTADKERLIVWFNGGPGCSSFDGLMMEVGPWRMDGKDSLKQKEGGWEEYSNVLYLDQPPGTGFSYTSTDSYLHELDDSAAYVVEFLKNWYEVFPEFKEMDTYLAGESYAGQYIPYVADALLKTRSLSVPLKGIAIGNGWIDPLTQYPAYIEFAVKEKLLAKGSKEYKSAMDALDTCEKAMNTTELTPHIGVCELLLGKAVDHLQSTVNGKTMCVNVYDIRLSDTYPACGMNWPPDLVNIGPYLRRDDVRVALHVPESAGAWTECRGNVGMAFSARKSRPANRLIPGIIESGVEVMLFSGDQDLICNHIGTERMIETMVWNDATGFNTSSKPLAWSVNGTSAGEWTIARNLTYVKVFGASHMVGFDLPHVAHDMILRFMRVDFSQINSHVGSTGALPSSLGGDVKPVEGGVPSKGAETGGGGGSAGGGSGSGGGTTPPPKTVPSEDDTAMWQAYYNAGSAALVLVVIALVIGGGFYIRSRRRASEGGVKLASDRHRDEEESIPLTHSQSVGGGLEGNGSYVPIGEGEGNGNGDRKGKGRQHEHGDREEDGDSKGGAIFDVGDSDDDEDGHPPRTR